jgi:hypothetical protein
MTRSKEPVKIGMKGISQKVILLDNHVRDLLFKQFFVDFDIVIFYIFLFGKLLRIYELALISKKIYSFSSNKYFVLDSDAF